MFKGKHKNIAMIIATVMIISTLWNTTTAIAAEQDVAEGSLKVDAKSAVLMDAMTGTVLYEQNSHTKLPPASVTKIMTMLLSMEAIEQGQITMGDRVTISERAASMGGSQMYMEVGEVQTVENLLKGMAICSANDACVAMAEWVGGTEEIFVERMNQKAKELGLKDTHFVNTNGLPVADHYTSANDIAVMAKELMKFSEPKEWFTTWQTTITVGLEGKKQTELGLTNTNRLIRQYNGATGIKTGFTQDAGYCLAGSAQRGDLSLIAVVMGCTSSKIRFAETGRLLDYGFATYDCVKVAEKGTVLGTAEVEKGALQTVNAVCKESIGVLVKKGQQDQIKNEIEFKEIVEAPLKEGAEIGSLIVKKNGKLLQTYPLYAQTQVNRIGFLEGYTRMMKQLVIPLAGSNSTPKDSGVSVQ